MGQTLIISELTDKETAFISSYNKNNHGHVYAVGLSKSKRRDFTRQEMNKVITGTITWKGYKIKPIYA